MLPDITSFCKFPEWWIFPRTCAFKQGCLIDGSLWLICLDVTFLVCLVSVQWHNWRLGGWQSVSGVCHLGLPATLAKGAVCRTDSPCEAGNVFSQVPRGTNGLLRAGYKDETGPGGAALTDGGPLCTLNSHFPLNYVTCWVEGCSRSGRVHAYSHMDLDRSSELFTTGHAAEFDKEAISPIPLNT